VTPEVRRKLRFRSEFHDRLLRALRDRLSLAEKKEGERTARWKENEERYLAYLPASEADKVLAAKRQTGEGPQTTTLIIPMSYALLMTWHTYMSSVLLGRRPVHQWEGRTQAGIQGKLMVETHIDYQVRVGEHVIPLYVWLLDTGKYGQGVLGYYWTDETTYITEVAEAQVQFYDIPVPGKGELQERIVEVPGYEGNKVYNIHPSRAHFDPRVPLMEYQRGEFVVVEVGSVAKGDILSNPDFFNRDIVSQMDDKGVLPDNLQSPQLHLPDEESDSLLPSNVMGLGTVHPKEYYLRLVPREWGLGSNEGKEIWVFTVLWDRVIVGARPLGNYSQKFPVVVAEHEPDGYQVSKRSFLEIMGPLQDFLDWLINTHRLNVAKAINDVLIVDPSLVYMSDVREPLPGKLIRARPEAYGEGLLEKAVHQLRITDVTQEHLRTAGVVMEMMQRVSGVTEQVMGMLQPGGRKTAQEIRTSATFGVNRLKTEAEWISAQAWMPLAQALLQNTQQWMSREVALKIVSADAGLSAENLQKYVKVTPESIRGFYDYVPVEGTLPVDRMAQAQVLIQLLGTMGQAPGVLGQYDLGGVFGWIAELMGAKGLKNFKVQLSPDEVIARQLAEGNVVKREDVSNEVGVDAGAAFGGGEGSAGPAQEGRAAAGAAPLEVVAGG